MQYCRQKVESVLFREESFGFSILSGHPWTQVPMGITKWILQVVCDTCLCACSQACVHTYNEFLYEFEFKRVSCWEANTGNTGGRKEGVEMIKLPSTRI